MTRLAIAMKRSKALVAATVIGSVAAMTAAPAGATMQLANELGTVIASEEACGLTFDQAAIAAFIDERVPDDDMGFPSMLQTMIAGTEFQLRDMSESAKTAHCTQIRRVARRHGFVD